MVSDIELHINTNGFKFTSIVYPAYRKDAIDILPDKPWEEYVDFINRNKITKAKVTMPELNGIQRCGSLKYLYILPPQNAPKVYDFSPLYDMPEIKYLNCSNRTGENWRYMSEIDYSRINGLKALRFDANRKAKHYNNIQSLKSLCVSSFKGANGDLTDLFCSTELDTLWMLQCGNQSLNGIGRAHEMKCVYLHNNRSLEDICALYDIKDSITALRIDNCPKIRDFSVLRNLQKLELLELFGTNSIESLSFIRNMPNLKTLILSMNVLDGDLSECTKLSYVYVDKIRRHYNVKEADLPKGEYIRGNESIEMWRRLE